MACKKGLNSCVIHELLLTFLALVDCCLLFGMVALAQSAGFAPVRPLMLPDTFCGSSESNWTDWKCHFDNVAYVNAWSEEDKLKWLKIRLTGRTKTAFQHLSEANRVSYVLATTALKEWFEQTTRKHGYQAELHTRRKRTGQILLTI